MSIYERQKQIMQYLKEKNFATVKELSVLVYASEASVRRDIKVLADRGLLHPIYGGVVLPEYKNGVVPISLRDTSHTAAKEEIARAAAEMIFDGATVIMDGSTTVRRIIKYIKASPVYIITNNVRILNEELPDGVTVYGTGGLFLPQSNIFVGKGAQSFLNGINADLLFFSSQAISSTGEISDASEEETALRQAMLTRAKKRIFLCDASKLGQTRTFTVCTREDVDTILCDAPLPWEE